MPISMQMDSSGRYFHVKDGDSVRNPGRKPTTMLLGHYECRHGMSYTRITGRKTGLGLRGSFSFYPVLGERFMSWFSLT